MTLPLNKGGLGVKKLDIFNLALLNKWRWRILQGKSSLWLDLLKARYGDISLEVLGTDDQVRASSLCSWWWKDITKIYSASSLSPHHTHDPIASGCKFIIHNGFITSFWFAAWLENIPLVELYPELFKFSSMCLH